MKKLLLTISIAALGCLSALAQQTNTEAQKTALDVLHEKEAKISAERARQQEKDAIKKAKEEAARLAKEEKEAAKKAKAIAEANRKEAEKRARIEQEAIRKAREEELTERKAREEQAAKRAKLEAEALKKAKAEEAARKEKEAKELKEVAARNKSEEAARKIADEKAKAEAKAQEKLKEQQLAESKKQEKEAAKRAEAERKALAKMRADEAERQAKAAKEARETAAKAKANEEAAQKLAAKQAAEKTRLAEAEAKKAKESEEAARKAEAKERARKEKEAIELAKKAQEREEALRKAQVKTVKAESRSNSAVVPPAAPVAASEDAKSLQQLREKRAALAQATEARSASEIRNNTSEAELAAGKSHYARNAQSAYYEELWQKELQERAAKQARQKSTSNSAAPVVASTGKEQARYYEELWKKQQDEKAAKAAADAARLNKEQVAALKAAEAQAQASSKSKDSSKHAKKSDEAAKKMSNVHDEPVKKARELELTMKQKADEEAARARREADLAAQQAKVAQLEAEKARLKADASSVSTTGDSKANVVYDGELYRIVKVNSADQKAPQEKAKEKEALEAIRRKEAEIKAEKAKIQAAEEQSRRLAALKAKEEEAALRKQKAAEEAARKAQEKELARKAELEEAMAKKAKAEALIAARHAKEAEEAAQRAEAARQKTAEKAARKEKAALEPVALKVAAPVEAAPASNALSEESEAQARALEALRRKQAELDSLESKIKAEAAQAAPQNERSTGFFKKKNVVNEDEVRAKAIEAVRQKDAEKALPSTPARVAAQPAVSPADNSGAKAAVDDATAEAHALQQKLARISREQAKVKKDLAAAQERAKNTSPAANASGGTEIVVDNSQAKKTGDWIEGKSGGFFGKNYLFKGKGNGSSSLLFAPEFPVAGDYEVYEWHVAGGNRASDAPFVVTYANGTQTIPVNQQLNGAQWNLIGTFRFDAGKSGNVRVTDTISIQGQMVMADAVRFVLVGSNDKGTTVADSQASDAVEKLQAKQEELNKDAARLKNQLKSAEKRVAEAKRSVGENTSATSVATPAPEVESNVQARALEALRRKEAELVSQEPKAKKTAAKASMVKTSKAAPAVAAEPQRPLTEKEQKLADLLRRYKNDEIGPREYHQQRAKIIAEP